MENYEKTIVAHARKTAPRECCGVVIRSLKGLKAVPLHNVSPEPEKSFIINPRAYLPYLGDGSLLEYYHSHPISDEIFSEADKKMSEGSGYPCVVYSLITQKFARYVPNGYVVPLIGRKFILGIMDCFSLMDDYYRSALNVVFPAYDHEAVYYNEGIPMETFCKELKFRRVTEIKKHDVIAMSLGNSKGMCNHLGIYLGKDSNSMLHQLNSRPSGVVVYGGFWEKHTTGIYRHESQL